MSEELKAALNEHSVALDAAMEKFEGQVAEQGKADGEIRAEVKTLSEKFESSMTEIAQKMEVAGQKEDVVLTAGAEFIKSDAFQALVEGKSEKARVEVKNTVVADTTTVFPNQMPGVIAGSFLPLTSA